MARALSLRRVVIPVRSCIFLDHSPDCARRRVDPLDASGPLAPAGPASVPGAVDLVPWAHLAGLPNAAGAASPPRPPRAALSG